MVDFISTEVIQAVYVALRKDCITVDWKYEIARRMGTTVDEVEAAITFLKSGGPGDPGDTWARGGE